MFLKKGPSLDQMIDEFLLARLSERYSPHTIRSYEVILHKFSDFLGGSRTRFASVGISDIRRFLGSLNGVSDKTVLNHHIALSSLWSWAVENGYTDEQIVQKTKTPRYTKRRIIPFSAEEFRKIYRACRTDRDRAIVMVLVDSGLRASELTNLVVEDWQNGVLQIRQAKGKKSRAVPISQQTEKALFRQLGCRRIREGGIVGGAALFASSLSGKPLCYDTLRSLLDRLEKYSSVRGVHAHRFRHTFAITFLRNGGDIYTLKRILGHSTLTMVQNYLDIVQSDVIAAHQKASPVVNWQIGK